MSRTFTPLLLFALPFVIAGCANRGAFPSLAPRAVEQMSMEEPVRVDPAVAPDPALTARAAALLARARQGDRAFDAAYARAQPAVRAAGRSGTDSWVEAQQAVSRVEAAGIETSSALADLDRLISDQADDPTSDQDHARLLTDRAAAEALAAQQQQRVRALRTRLGAP